MAENREPRTQNPGRPVRGSAGRYSFRNLILWQKGQEPAVRVIRHVAAMEPSRAGDIVAGQIIRSVTSVSANVAEGHGRFSLPAHRNYLSIAKASACETDSWLDLLRRLDLMQAVIEADMHENCEELIRMLTSKILDLEAKETALKSRAKGVREEPAIYETRDYTEDAPGSGFSGSGFSGSRF